MDHDDPRSSGDTGKEPNYLSILDRVQAGVVVHSAQTDIIFANQVAAKVLGWPSDELLGVDGHDPRWDFLNEDGTEMPTGWYPVNRVLSLNRPVNSLVLGVRRKNQDRLIWLMCNAYPVHDDLGEIYSIVVSFTDISELKRTSRALAASEERLRLVMRATQDAPWDFDLVTREMHCSPQWWALLGLPDDTPIDLENPLARYVHTDDQVRVAQQYERAMGSTAESYEIDFRIVHSSGRIIPVVSKAFITRDPSGKACRVSGAIVDLTERRRNEEQIHRLAYFDPLTELPNRRSLAEVIRRMMQAASTSDGDEHALLLLIDLDSFKAINESLGHEAGDQLLQRIAKRIQTGINATDSVYRIGGDEFCVLAPRNTGNSSALVIEAARLGHSILRLFDSPFEINDENYRSSASIGIAIFDRSTGMEQLGKQIDMAKNQAKAAGGGVIRFFDAAMQSAVDLRLALERDLRDSLKLNQMSLHFQAQFTDAGRITGAEVLLRWHHPNRGLVMPNEFISHAERLGVIDALGEWVIEKACSQLAMWASDPKFQGISISVNVSVLQFQNIDFAKRVKAIVDASGANPSLLRLEITETLLASNMEVVITAMREITDRGITFSLDDFGVGYSSLSYLQSLPLSEIKIDRTFVKEIETNANHCAIARVIIKLAGELSFHVIAEGVETERQVAILARAGCTSFQGYYFARPQSIEEFELMVRHRKSSHSVRL